MNANSVIDPQLLALIRCPKTGQPLRMGTEEELQRVAAAVERGTCCDASGESVTDPPAGGLVTADGSWLYPIRDQIPALIPGEAISLSVS